MIGWSRYLRMLEWGFLIRKVVSVPNMWLENENYMIIWTFKSRDGLMWHWKYLESSKLWKRTWHYTWPSGSSADLFGATPTWFAQPRLALKKSRLKKAVTGLTEITCRPPRPAPQPRSRSTFPLFHWKEFANGHWPRFFSWLFWDIPLNDGEKHANIIPTRPLPFPTHGSKDMHPVGS